MAPQVQAQMLNIADPQGNANAIYHEVSPRSNTNGHVE